MMQQHDLLAKYDVSGPRYTSYPTVVQFDDAIDELHYILHSQQQPSRFTPLSLYIHLPFCKSLCHYCACNKVITKKPDQIGPYLDHLHREMALIKLQLGVEKRPIVQLHWGGGTPTFLDIAEMTELMHLTSTYFNLSRDEDRDFSVEIDPRTVGENEIGLLHGLGFNRISLGVQDFNSRVQKAIHRVHSFSSVEKIVSAIRNTGFQSLNFDLIYGLPFQTKASIRKTLKQVISLSPDRISYYNYAHLPDRFPAQKSIARSRLPDAEIKIGMLTTIIDELADAGYVHIGMDHFVKPTDKLAIARATGKLTRNFQGYTIALADDIVGLGVSAISSMGTIMVQNYRELNNYYAHLDRNILPIERGVILSQEDTLRKDIIHQLLCYRILDIGALEEKYHIDFWRHFASSIDVIRRMCDDDILAVNDRSLEVPARGIPFLRNVAMQFDAYLGASKPAFGIRSAQYSKVL